MKRNTKNNQTLQLVISHSIAIAAFTNPYFIYLLTDLYRLATGDISEFHTNESLSSTMALISTTALLVAIVSFTLYIIRKKK